MAHGDPISTDPTDPTNAFADPGALAAVTAPTAVPPTVPPAVAAALAAPAAAPPKPAKNKKAPVTAEVWAEVQVMYEAGNYSQRDLVDYCKSRGLRISQSRIARKATVEGWIKGSRLKEIQEKILEDFKKRAGDRINQMLENHHKMSQGVMAECLQHMKQAQLQREANPNFVMPTGNLRNITEILRTAMDMEARALGFDYKTGKTVKDNDAADAANTPTPMVIRTLTQGEEAAIRKKAEEEFGTPKSDE